MNQKARFLSQFGLSIEIKRSASFIARAVRDGVISPDALLNGSKPIFKAERVKELAEVLEALR